jgi:hypothetical protein
MFSTELRQGHATGKNKNVIFGQCQQWQGEKSFSPTKPHNLNFDKKTLWLCSKRHGLKSFKNWPLEK